ncbi:MAG TPA: DUF4187 domain-containing protein [Candidatus Nitrosocosmicus sp.]|nr:DUF4187 domain-containing protein [Candidatus Nitrosocosmicus sp.]
MTTSTTIYRSLDELQKIHIGRMRARRHKKYRSKYRYCFWCGDFRTIIEKRKTGVQGNTKIEQWHRLPKWMTGLPFDRNHLFCAHCYASLVWAWKKEMKKHV